MSISYYIWDIDPAVLFDDDEGYYLRDLDKGWEKLGPLNVTSVYMDGIPLSKEDFYDWFGDLPPIPTPPDKS
ncbi:MAG: hypothetical protein GC190_21145 [Alphaproteobacteria bacterium]|nr:hypothetical protein [Alphaproteobacteria bacterium]